MTNQEMAVITGMGLLTPLGENKETFWDQMQKGTSGIKDISVFDTSNYEFQRAGEVSNFDPALYLGKKGHKFLSRATKFAMSAAYLSLVDAGIKDEERQFLCYEPHSMGAIIGTTYGSLASLCSFDAISIIDGPQLVSPMVFPNTVINCHTGYLAIKECIQGMTFTVSSGYAASLDAIGISVQYLTSGNAKCIIAGGLEELSEEFYLSYLKQDLLSTNACIGEGCGLFAIENLSAAIERGAKIYGQIAGYGNALSENGEGLRRAVGLAMDEAKILADDIDLIVGGLNVSDREKGMETEVLESLFRPETQRVDLRDSLGDSYSAGGSFQVGAALGFLEQGTGNNILITAIDPSGNASALIIKRYQT